MEDSEKVASRHASICANRLHYLQQVDQLAIDNRNGVAEYETMEEDDEDVETTSRQRKRLNKASTTITRNVNDMDVDSTSAASVTSNSKSAVSNDDVPDFVVSPQMRVDRLFADHLLRTGQ